MATADDLLIDQSIKEVLDFMVEPSAPIMEQRELSSSYMEAKRAPKERVKGGYETMADLLHARDSARVKRNMGDLPAIKRKEAQMPAPIVHLSAAQAPY